MIKTTHLVHQFVDNMPETLGPGVLYVSMRYALAMHLCCCGCGREISTPFSPAQWKMSFDGDGVSIAPSIGSWNLACRSHYFIDRGRVIEALPWSERAVEYGQERDRRSRDRYYGVRSDETALSSVPVQTPRRTWRAWISGLFD
jgi:hypothetical protein